ncbi:hypothetical protein ON010_g3197 [Phytophthora cinnamomi]|nr:hypothetical protein ON010_g3197 [Phytophthora cinnamomi]
MYFTRPPRVTKVPPQRFVFLSLATKGLKVVAGLDVFQHTAQQPTISVCERLSLVHHAGRDHVHLGFVDIVQHVGHRDALAPVTAGAINTGIKGWRGVTGPMHLRRPQRHVKGLALASARVGAGGLALVLVAHVGTLGAACAVQDALVNCAQRVIVPVQDGLVAHGESHDRDADLVVRPALVAGQPAVPDVDLPLEHGLKLGRHGLGELPALGVPAHAVVELSLAGHDLVEDEVVELWHVLGHGVLPDPVHVLAGHVRGGVAGDALAAARRDLAKGSVVAARSGGVGDAGRLRAGGGEGDESSQQEVLGGAPATKGGSKAVPSTGTARNERFRSSGTRRDADRQEAETPALFQRVDVYELLYFAPTAASKSTAAPESLRPPILPLVYSSYRELQLSD